MKGSISGRSKDIKTYEHMIRFKDKSKEIEIEVSGYEFEYDKVDDEYDRNWLNVSVRYRNGARESSITDPSILTWEIKDTINWLEGFLGEDCDDTLEGDYLEPYIWFHLRRRNGVLSGDFHIGYSNVIPSCVFKGTFSSEWLGNIIAELKAILERFPERD